MRCMTSVRLCTDGRPEFPAQIRRSAVASSFFRHEEHEELEGREEELRLLGNPGKGTVFRAAKEITFVTFGFLVSFVSKTDLDPGKVIGVLSNHDEPSTTAAFKS
jgi:hypothetical protein